MNKRPIRFIHISDTHIGPTKDFMLRTIPTYPCAEKLLYAINNVPEKPDFVMHTGDVVEMPYDEKGYQLAAKLLSESALPLYHVTGNHDISPLLIKHVPSAEYEKLGAKTENSYRFDREGIRFLTLDARGKDEIDPQGELSTGQLEILGAELSRNNKLIIFIHYPPIQLDSIWIKNKMTVINGEKMHRMLVEHKENVLGVFFGHVHRGMQVVKDGIFYSSVGSPNIQFQAWPSNPENIYESTGQSYFNYVTIQDNQVTVKEYSIPNGTDVFVKTRGEI